MYQILQIDRLQADDIEYLGTKPKFWFRVNNNRYLFKADKSGSGEDWAEKVVCELAGLLGLPKVDYTLAYEFEGGSPVQAGVVCPTFTPPPLSLVMGDQLLFQHDPNYPVAAVKKYGVQEYTLDSVAEVVGALLPPPQPWMVGVPAGISAAISVFTGYVMLDAWVANQDRHHQNWGAIQEGAHRYLAPTYDHGSSLARTITDAERMARLDLTDQGYRLPAFASRARSAFYETKNHKQTMRSLDVFSRFAKIDAAAAEIWLEKLSSLKPLAFEAILAEVPSERMSTIAKRFTLELLTFNQGRLLEGSFL